MVYFGARGSAPRGRRGVGLEVAFFHALWLMLPAYAANPSAQLTGGGLPIDFGKTARDGKPLLGPGKTWRGFLGGVLGAMFVGSLQVAGSAALGNPDALPSFDPSGGRASVGSF